MSCVLKFHYRSYGWCSHDDDDDDDDDDNNKVKMTELSPTTNQAL